MKIFKKTVICTIIVLLGLYILTPVAYAANCDDDANSICCAVGTDCVKGDTGDTCPIAGQKCCKVDGATAIGEVCGPPNFEATAVTSGTGAAAPTGGILPACVATGDCDACDFVQLLVNIGVFILGFVGSVTLLFFVYGGLTMLTSAGRTEPIQKGKDILINSAIGLAIVLLAYPLIVFIVNAVVKEDWKISGNAWWSTRLNCEGGEPIDSGGAGSGSTGEGG